MKLHLPPDFLDLLIELNRASANGFRMGSPPFRVIGRGDLIKNKRAAGRPQDLADVDVLERQSKH